MKTKSKKADLEGKKALFFQVGVVIALALALTAFEWPSRGDINLKIPVKPGVIETPEDVIITNPDKIKLPPPPPLAPMPDYLVIREDNLEIPDFDPDLFTNNEGDRMPDIIIKRFENDVDEVIPFLLIEDKPSFMGGDYNTFAKWVAQRIVYPEPAAANGIQGRVTLQFLIDVDGTVKDIKVVQSIDKMLADEAVRVVSQSPPWSPGKQRGKPTKVLFTFPFTFRLQ